MIRGERVVVRRKVLGVPDKFGSPSVSWVEEPVSDVLVAPNGVADVEGSVRPDGVRVKWALHFPKNFVGSLKGCEVKVRSDKPRPVVGDPQPYTPENTPGRWNLPVLLEDVDG